MQLPAEINHPARVAERISALDLLSHGRVDFGTGEASSSAELDGFGVDWDTKRAQWADNLDAVTRMMVLDTIGYMNDDILTKVDRASMAVSLESRIPLLDPAVAEFAWSLPLDLKLRRGTNKWVLRQLLYRLVPQGLVDRRKAGFAVPIGEWLRGPLREWAEDLLSVSQLEREGYLRAARVRQTWKEHLSGRRDWYAPLWNVLMFQSWIRADHAS